MHGVAPGAEDEGPEAGAGGRAATAAGEPSGAPAGGSRGHARDLTVLRADYEFEDAAVRRYGHMAVEAADPGLAALFQELARGEAGHRRGLRRTIATIEDPATPVIVFCPLCGWELDFGPDPADGTQGKCPMCPGRFALRLDAGGDWTLERLAP